MAFEGQTPVRGEVPIYRIREGVESSDTTQSLDGPSEGYRTGPDGGGSEE